ncbi:tetratricopeptide repeat protein [Rhizobium leguminosarum]|uniref:tetratricopeptide repeat protein n=1 Tax=Rhizobium leguminosarum TaxID=384 RepID=UPI003F985F04
MTPFEALAAAYRAFSSSDYKEAEKYSRELLEISPYNRNAIQLLRASYLAMGGEDAAAWLDEQISKEMPWYVDVETRIASRSLQAGRLEIARAKYDRALNMPISFEETRMLPFGEVSKARITHDLFYLEYMRENGMFLDQKFEDCIDALRLIADGLDENETARLSAQELNNISAIYRRCLHLEDVKTPSLVINRMALENALKEFISAPEDRKFCYFDGLFTEKALEQLTSYLLRSTIWHNDGQKGKGYLGAYETNGLRHPLIDNIIEEIENGFRSAFGEGKVSQLWCYKNIIGRTGVGAHADFSNLNLNVWLTPDRYNLDTGSGGLVIYHKRAPADWCFEKYNGDHEAINALLNNCERTAIPYRCNRAMIFDSSLFHASNGVNFKRSHEGGRLNLTFLFGLR